MYAINALFASRLCERNRSAPKAIQIHHQRAALQPAGAAAGWKELQLQVGNLALATQLLIC